MLVCLFVMFVFFLAQTTALKPVTPFHVYDESRTPNIKMRPSGNFDSKNRMQLFKEDANDLADRLESQAKLNVPMFNVHQVLVLNRLFY